MSTDPPASDDLMHGTVFTVIPARSHSQQTPDKNKSCIDKSIRCYLGYNTATNLTDEGEYNWSPIMGRVVRRDGTRSTCVHKDNTDRHGSKYVGIVLLFTALSQSREHKDKVMENKTLP